MKQVFLIFLMHAVNPVEYKKYFMYFTIWKTDSILKTAYLVELKKVYVVSMNKN
jgi:hypothetical protein